MAEEKKRAKRNPREYAPTLEGWRGGENKWRAVIALPERMTSNILLDGEKLLLVLRQHWVVVIPKVLLGIVLLIIPIIVAQIPLMEEIADPALMRVLMMMSYLAIGGYFLQLIVIWWFNVYLITDERLIDVAFASILNSDTSITKIDKVQDHSVKSGGFWEPIFRYGTIEIQTAGKKNEFFFTNIPEVDKVNRLLGELIEEEELEEMEGRTK